MGRGLPNYMTGPNGHLANLVLQSSIERIFIPPPESDEGAADANGDPSSAPPRGLYADVDRGTFLVRGENVLLLGEIDLDRDDDAPPGYDKAELDVVQRLARERKGDEKTKEKLKVKKLATLGFEGENIGETLL